MLKFELQSLDKGHFRNISGQKLAIGCRMYILDGVGLSCFASLKLERLVLQFLTVYIRK